MRTGASALVIVFAKAPVAGAVKTRLVPRLGADGAARLQRRLIRAALAAASGVARVELHATRSHAWLRALGVPVRVQRGADLGERMFRALRGPLRRHRAVVLIGSDAPELKRDDIQRALRLLRGAADVVLAPAEDGGYALIGARRIRESVFGATEWGGPRGLAQALGNLERSGLRYRCLRTVWDVDRPQDLDRLRSLRFSSASRPRARR